LNAIHKMCYFIPYDCTIIFNPSFLIKNEETKKNQVIIKFIIEVIISSIDNTLTL